MDYTCLIEGFCFFCLFDIACGIVLVCWFVFVLDTYLICLCLWMRPPNILPYVTVGYIDYDNIKFLFTNGELNIFLTISNDILLFPCVFDPELPPCQDLCWQLVVAAIHIWNPISAFVNSDFHMLDNLPFPVQGTPVSAVHHQPIKRPLSYIKDTPKTKHNARNLTA